jgi:ParB family chromosome partitioning protein
MGDIYEVLSGNQRLMVLRDLGLKAVPCFVTDLDDAHARLLAQALNHIQGQDDLGLRAELVRTILDTIPDKEIAAILPETVENLKALASMGQETIAEYLENWQKAQAAKLKHLQFQLTTKQLEVIEEAMAKIMPQASQMRRDNPNARGTALYLLCKSYLEREVNGH